MILSVRGVRKSFGDTEVLRGMDLDVGKGDVVAILGPSGSGKTTFLRCLDFLERADSGTMESAGVHYYMHTIGKKDIAAIRKRSGFVFQGFNLFRNRTALENVTEGLIVARKMPRREAERIGKETLGKVGMADWADRYPSELSGGQQQRVAIARAIAPEPEIVYFDEPTSALDPELAGEVLAVMRMLAEEGTTMVVVTHAMDFARNVSSRILFMENGIVVEEGDTAAFFASPAKERTREFLRTAATAGEMI